jgi:NADPH-dependent curcumin reductase
MPAVKNKQILLASRPVGEPGPANFKIAESELREPGEGEILLKTLWLSLDPYMRGRMSDAPSYAPPVAIGEVMTGGTVARVERSLNAAYFAGDLVVAHSGWQEFAISDGSGLVKLPADVVRPSYALGVLGMPGFTAYIGLLDIGRPKAGETVVVAAATGAVGSVVGQIAKLKGCRVVGIAGGPEKCDWAVRELGFDACVDHRSEAFGRSLAEACAKGAAGQGAAGQGIDIYFENVGGNVFRTVVPLLNPFARIPVCGLISAYNEPQQPADGEFVQTLMRAVLVKRLTLRGFIFSDDYQHRLDEFLTALGGWVREGRIKYREDVVRGLENAPGAFLGLLEGRNFGKLVVDVGGAGA